MLQHSIRATFAFLAAGGLSAVLAVSPAIGVASAKGSFRVDRSNVRGTATLFQGTVIETGKVTSALQMNDGAQLRLGSLSQGQVFQERLVLQKGEGWIGNARNYRVQAADLLIVPASTTTHARVSLAEDRRVRVASLAGGLDVVGADGTLLARLNSGDALEFAAQSAGAAAPFTLVGCLIAAQGHHYLKDETANVTFELTGTGLAGFTGQRVEVSGVPVPSEKTSGNASQVVRVVRVKRISGSCAAPPPSASKGRTTKAIIAGVAVAAAGAGTTMGLIGEDEEPKPPISR